MPSKTFTLLFLGLGFVLFYWALWHETQGHSRTPGDYARLGAASAGYLVLIWVMGLAQRKIERRIQHQAGQAALMVGMTLLAGLAFAALKPLLLHGSWTEAWTTDLPKMTLVFLGLWVVKKQEKAKAAKSHS